MILRIFIILSLVIGSFCIGQWAAQEGYTLQRGWNYSQKMLPMGEIENWLEQAGVSGVGTLVPKESSSAKVAVQKQTRSLRSLPPMPVKPIKHKTVAEKDEEGLSPTDREALIDLLK